MLFNSILFLTIVCLTNCQINSVVQVKVDGSYCSPTVCKGMDYPSPQEVVSFQPDSTSTQKTIRFEDTRFSNFPLNLFLAFTNLTELDMRNCSIGHMTWENFLWAVDLKVLLLSNNYLTRLDELTFSYALNIQFLWLEKNRIRTLVSESFKGLTQLKYLSLMGNRLTSLPDGLFDDLRNLEVVILSENKIKNIQDNLFTKSPKLLSVDLKENRLHNVSDDAFRGLDSLMNLDLSHNKPLRSLILNIDVSNLHAEFCSLRQVNIYGHINYALMNGNRILELYFSMPESLQRLDLKNNSLQQIASLTRASNLNILDISDNPKLERVPDPWGVSFLQKLDVSNTGMKEFPNSVLGKRGVPLTLKYLNVSSNAISQIDPRLFNQMENITNFYFHDNNWSCYYLRLLMDLVIKPRNIAYSTDNFDSSFAGEYIEGIKCMHRNVDDEEVKAETAAKLTDEQANAKEEVDQLRNELKTIVRFYEEKFDKVFKSINDLKSRLDTLTAENASMWQHITLTT